jgi:hypothetical protein
MIIYYGDPDCLKTHFSYRKIHRDTTKKNVSHADKRYQESLL